MSDAPLDLPTVQNDLMPMSRRVHFFESSPLIVPILAIWIGLVSAYDIHLTIKYANYLSDYEINPVARAILEVDTPGHLKIGSLARFIGLIAGGTVVAISALFLLSHWQRRWANVVAIGVSIFQLILVGFLSFG